MFRSYDHPQGAYIVIQSYSLKTLRYLHRYVELVLWQHAATAPTIIRIALLLLTL